ncbi:MAG: YybS family protein [Synergistaceae bacterium]|jgi:uncharacterized protein YybS (DUF2232 family)|nr:YybS family protein [Synergistaceae bacterium]
MFASRFRDWLLFTATGCILYSIGLVSPMLTLPVTLIFSFPTAFLAFEYGAAWAMSSALFSSLAMGLAISLDFGLMYFLTFGFPGAVIGILAKSGPKGGDLLMAAGAAEFLGKLAGVLIFHLFHGINLLSPSTAEVEKSIMAYGGTALKNGEAAHLVIERVVLLAPYGVILFSAIEALFCLMLLSYIHRKRTGEAVYSPPPFKDWRFPKSILLALVVGFICGQISSGDNGSYLMRQIGANLTELSRTIFILQGLSCAYFLMERKGVSKPVRITAMLLTPFMPLLGEMSAILGVADMGFNLRERIEGGSR